MLQMRSLLDANDWRLLKLVDAKIVGSVGC